MSITNELRKYVRHYSVAGSSKDKTLTSIADRIDEAHKHAIAYVDDRDPETMAEHGWVKLPVDADGVTIRVGDRVQFLGSDPSTVSHMSLASDGWRVYVKYDGDLGTGSGEPNRIRHYHEPTVEDVLLEACKAYHGLMVESMSDVAHDMQAPSEVIAEYAAKLRLAGDGE